MTKAIIFDTETTGLIINRSRKLSLQPWTVELFALKIDEDSNEELETFHSYFEPKAIMTPDALKATGITDEFLKGKPQFSEHISTINDFFSDSTILVGQNLMFDINMLKFDFERCNEKFDISGKKLVDLLEATEYIKGFRMKLGDMYEHFFGERFSNAHEAEVDVRATARIYTELKRRQEI